MNDLSLEQLVYKFCNFIDSLDQDITKINSCLQQISQVLIAPISEFLPDEPNSTLIFIPQDFLFLIPFTALQDQEGNALIQKHIVLTAPSIQTLDLTNQPRRKTLVNSINSIVVGNPTMPLIMNDKEKKQLQELPASGAEAKGIASLLNTEAIIADQATKAKILEQIPQAKLIHFATHGLLDQIKESDIPGAIVLAPDVEDDGFLTSEEIMKMFGQSDQPGLQAELLVLSACETGLGKITGDGVVGLSRSLMAAGIPRVVVSLWKVSDLSTALLMIKFYEILKTKIHKNFINLKPADVAKAS